ncbi:GGDEF domain-containing protein [Leptothoe kymatousa TAU-MAC 1615]|uniref:GGDEF domain-containing protein n=2 Tax=Leptothoe TaxID=2651725 RepID=A0ABS5Y332_9CYAN|nr:GGDEF domain-containing protein [Leptothoe kymatousa TAU-MAC 1615]
MDLYPEQLQATSDFLRTSFLRLALVAIVFITPFAIYNFLVAQYLISIICWAILIAFTVNAGLIVWHNRYRIVLTQFGLVPIILLLLVVLLGQQETIGIFWCYPAAGSFHFMLPRRHAWLSTAVLFGVSIPLVSAFVPPNLAIRIVVTLALVSIAAAVFVRVITEQQHQLRVQAMTDPLTGLLNRTLLHETLDWAIEQSKRSELPMSLVAFDIDHFKSVNDTYGHDVGDDVLCRVSTLVKERVRRVDKVFRLGGEEFLILLHGTGKDAAQRVAEDLRERIALLELLPERSVTVSVGLATLQPNEDWTAWMKRSDNNLYRAKTGGRNRVEV